MDSPGSSISSLSASEATQLLKDILNVGKARSNGSGEFPGSSSLRAVKKCRGVGDWGLPYCQKTLWSEGPLVRKPFGQKARWSEF